MPFLALPTFLPSPAIPPTQLPRIPLSTNLQPTAKLSYPLSRRATLTLTTAALATLLFPTLPSNSSTSTSTTNATITDRVYFDITIAGRPIPRLIIGLFGEEAPTAVTTFKNLCLGDYKGRGSRRVGYRASTGWRVVKGERVDLGRISQTDEGAQLPGVAQRIDGGVSAPKNFEVNGLRHDGRGVVSVGKGGGGFEWTICTGREGCSGAMDEENLVIGKVVGGLDALDFLDKVPTNRKSSKAFRSVGRMIGDARAKVQLENKPIQKIVVRDVGVL